MRELEQTRARATQERSRFLLAQEQLDALRGALARQVPVPCTGSSVLRVNPFLCWGGGSCSCAKIAAGVWETPAFLWAELWRVLNSHGASRGCWTRDLAEPLFHLFGCRVDALPPSILHSLLPLGGHGLGLG